MIESVIGCREMCLLAVERQIRQISLKSSVELDRTLREWRLARIPSFLHSPSTIETDLAHGIARDLCEYALNYVDRSDAEGLYWRGIFIGSVSTLGIHLTEGSLNSLKRLDALTEKFDNVEIRFAVLRALMSNPPSVGSSMKEILQMGLPKEHLLTRDFFLERILAEEEDLQVSEEDRVIIANLTLRPDLPFSLKGGEKRITPLAKKFAPR